MKQMEKKKQQQPEEHPSPKQPYAPPKVIFVPLKLEERLLACGKFSPKPTTPCQGASKKHGQTS